MKYVKELDLHIQKEIRKALTDQLKDDYNLIGDDSENSNIEELVENGMDSKIADLEDVIDINKISKEANFRQTLLEEIIKDEYEYCFDRTYLSDDDWKKNNRLQTRTESFIGAIEELKCQDSLTLLQKYGTNYDYVYDKVRNGNNEQHKEILAKLGELKFVIYTPGAGFSKHQTIDSLFVDYVLDKISFSEDVLSDDEVHTLNLLSTNERKDLLQENGYQFIIPTLETVREWEFSTEKKFYDGIEFLYGELYSYYLPKGKMVHKYDDISPYVAIDNTTGDAFVEEFIDLNTCVDWLNNKDVDYHTERDLDLTKENKMER